MPVNLTYLNPIEVPEKIFSTRDVMWLLNISETTFYRYAKRAGILSVNDDGRFLYYKIDELITIYNYRYRKRARYRVFESKMNFNEVPL